MGEFLYLFHVTRYFLAKRLRHLHFGNIFKWQLCPVCRTYTREELQTASFGHCLALIRNAQKTQQLTPFLKS